MRLLLIGPPGGGKGTQAKELAEHFRVAHVASGDLFRKHQRENTELGQLAKSYMERGELVPDEVTIEMLLLRLQEPDCSRGYILDGFPRTQAQAHVLDNALRGCGESVDMAVFIRFATRLPPDRIWKE